MSMNHILHYLITQIGRLVMGGCQKTSYQPRLVILYWYIINFYIADFTATRVIHYQFNGVSKSDIAVQIFYKN